MNETKITMALGVIVLVAVAGLVINNARNGTRRSQISAAKTEVPAIIPKEEEGSYVVDTGDSLWTIAENFCQDGYKWTKIARDNGIAHPDLIYAGDILKIKCE